MYIGAYGKCPLYLPDFNKNLNVIFIKNPKILNFKRILPVVYALFHYANGQTDKQGTNSRFSQLICELASI
jgi:hypothetical protein